MPPAAILRVLIQAAGVADTNKQLMSVHATLQKVDAMRVKPVVDVDTSRAHKAIDKLKVQLGSLKNQTLNIDVSTSGVGTAVAGLSRLLALLRDAKDDAGDLIRKLRELGAVKAQPKVTVDSSAALAEIRKLKLQLAQLGGSSTKVNVGGSAAGLSQVGSAAGGATATIGGFKIALLVLIPVLIAFGGVTVATASALGPLIGLIPALGAAGIAAATGIGVLKLALGGIGDALKEQATNQRNAGTAAIENAGQQRAAARAIQSAQDGVRQATQAVDQAERDLGDAHRQQREALKTLGPAFTEARLRIRDLREAVVDAGLALRSAKLDARETHEALAALLSGPSPRVLADAHVAVEVAVRGEVDAVRGLERAHRALNELLAPANVLDLADAQDAVADSIRGQTRAELDLARIVQETQAILDDPSSSDAQRAVAALQLADAQNAVGDAARSNVRVVETLNRLQGGSAAEAVEQARLNIRDAELAVADATRKTADAQGALRDAQTPASALELAQARHAVALAENAVGDAERGRLDASRALGEAQRLGLRGAPEVVTALDAIRQANRAVEDSERALKDARLAATRASQALSDANVSASEGVAKMAGASANLNEKFNNLPASGQRFVRFLQDLKPRLDELRTTAADGFFPGAEAGISKAMGNFDVINKVVGETSAVLGDAAKKSGELVGSPAFGRDIQTIGSSNARVIGTLGEALRHVVSALRHVMVAAGPLTEWLAKVINQWALNAAEVAKSGRETGKLAAFFEKTRAVAERLGSILGRLTGGLNGVRKAGVSSGNDVLESIDRAAGRFDRWANSAAGQSALKDFFREAKELAAALVPVFGGVASAVVILTLKFAPLTAALQVIGPMADEAVLAFVAWKVAMIAWGIQVGIAKFLTGGWTTAFWALNAAMAANPIGLVVVAVAALVAAFVLLGGNLSTLTDAFGAAWSWIKTAASDTLAWLSEKWAAVVGILTGPVKDAIEAIKGFGGDVLGAAKWLLDQFVAGVKAGFVAVVSLGGWVVGRVVEGVKAAVGFAADVGGWLKNRVVEGVQAAVEGFIGLGGWIVNRIIDGFKIVGEALASVGGWLKNRVVELVHLGVEGFTGLGGWVLNRIVDGFKVVSEALGSVGGWLKNRIGDLIGATKDGFMDFGGKIINWIVDGLKGGANLLIGFINKIIGAINIIPGVDIGKIEKFAEGGVNVKGMAHGGAFARTGGVVNSPIVLMGEEAPAWPEIVIPSNPAYRQRAQALYAQAGSMIGLAEGGVVSAFKSAASRASAGPKSTLALFMAGVVESAMRNLPYGHLDSRGALQIRDSTAQSMGIDNMNPFASAMAFLTRGFWGKGSANMLARANHNATAGWVAQQTQGSNFPGRYDTVRDQALALLSGKEGGGGGIISAITGALGDLLSKGANFILDKLPGLGELPDWLKGTGKYAIDQATAWIKGKVSDVIGLGGGGGAPSGGVSGSIKGAMALARDMGLAITSTTGGQHTKGSWHYAGRAADVAGSAGQMAAFFNAALERYGSHLLELFYDPLGAIDNGKRIPAIGGHSDHVHIALARGGLYGGLPYGGSFIGGGIVPGSVGAPQMIRAHGGEVVLPEGMTLHADIYIGGERIDERVDVRLRLRERQQVGAWNAGVRS